MNTKQTFLELVYINITVIMGMIFLSQLLGCASPIKDCTKFCQAQRTKKFQTSDMDCECENAGPYEDKGPKLGASI